MSKKDEKRAGIFETLKDIYSTYYGEFIKIVWPPRPELIRKTITVAVISTLFGVYIAVLDGMLASAFSAFVGFIS